jgi:hypothetical protein
LKPKSISRHKYSGELYKFISKQQGSEFIVEYYFAKKINITAGLTDKGRMGLKCDEPLAEGFLIKNIKDSSGNLIMSDTSWRIESVYPVLNAFNTIDSYRMTAGKYQGSI